MTLFGPCDEFPLSGQSFGEGKPDFESEMSKRQLKTLAYARRNVGFWANLDWYPK